MKTPEWTNPGPLLHPKKKTIAWGKLYQIHPDTTNWSHSLKDPNHPGMYTRCGVFFWEVVVLIWIGIPNAYYCSLKVDAVSRNHKKHWGQKKTWVDTQNKEARPFFVFFSTPGTRVFMISPIFLFFFSTPGTRVFMISPQRSCLFQLLKLNGRWRTTLRSFQWCFFFKRDHP